MNRWKVYGSVSDLVKQFENAQSHANTELKKSHSLENIKKAQNFRNVYDKFENKEPDADDSPLRKFANTNHLECLQLQEINQARKKVYEIVGKSSGDFDRETHVSYFKEVSQIILSVESISDYGHVSIKSEKAQILALLHRCYVHIRDKLKDQNCVFEEDELVKVVLSKCGIATKKSMCGHRRDSNNTVSENVEKISTEASGTMENQIRKHLYVQKKYDKKITNATQSQNSHQKDSSNSSITSRKISRLYSPMDQNRDSRLTAKLSYLRRSYGEQDRRNEIVSIDKPKSFRKEKKFIDDEDAWDTMSSSSDSRTFSSTKSYEDYKDKKTPQAKTVSLRRSFSARDGKDRWDNISNCSDSTRDRQFWQSFRTTSELHNQERYETESDNASIVSGHEMFGQKYSGIAERINSVLKKQMSLLEEDGLLN